MRQYNRSGAPWWKRKHIQDYTTSAAVQRYYPIQSNSSMHHYKWQSIALCKDTSLQRPILHQISSLMHPRIQRRQVIMMFFIQVVCGCPSGRLQCSGGGLKMAWLASAWHYVTYEFINNTKGYTASDNMHKWVSNHLPAIVINYNKK